MLLSFRSRWRATPWTAGTPAGVDMDLASLSSWLHERIRGRRWYPEDLPQQRHETFVIWHGNVGLLGDRASSERTHPDSQCRAATALGPRVHFADSGQIAE